MKTGTVRHKNQAKVRIQIVGEEAFTGIVFLAIGDRLIDLLNDDRAFIPVKRDEGGVIIVAKSQIASIINADAGDDEVAPNEPVAEPEDVEDSDDLGGAGEEEETASGPEDNSSSKAQDESADKKPEPKTASRFDPYETLRVASDATIEEIRSAYKTRIKAVHPDSIAALGLDEDLAKAALHTTQKVNYAYRKIMKERETAAEAEEKTDQTATAAEQPDAPAKQAAG